MLKHERKNQYGGHKSGVVDRIFVVVVAVVVLVVRVVVDVAP